MTLSSIRPQTITNDRSANLTLTGAGFVEGLQVTIGEQPLEDVKVRSATSLNGSVPAGLCPGTYQASLTDPLGREISGGELVVEGVRVATVSGPQASAGLQLNGRSKRLAVALPSVRVEDTTCGGDVWQLSFSISEFTHSAANRPPLRPRSVQVDWPGAARPASAVLARTDGPSKATLVVPRPAGHPGTTLSPSLEVEVPASAYVGPYSATMSITIAEGP